jgi:hypothetical protein
MSNAEEASGVSLLIPTCAKVTVVIIINNKKVEIAFIVN